MKNTAKDVWARMSPYNRFIDFIEERADRYAILIDHIEKLKLNSTVINIEGNRHIFIFPPGQKSIRSSKGVFPFSGKNPYLLCAHYDRVEGSPGANDNSIAVFHLLSAALTLASKGIDNWIILFTDKEELTSGDNLEDQGSFSLAKKIASWGLRDEKIYIFDSCGTGEVFLFSNTTDHILKKSETASINKLRSEIKDLRDHALAAANRLRLEKVLLAPTPFSDDAGFLRAGLASLTITMLPSHEAEKYETMLRSRENYADLIISGAVKTQDEKRRLPETWQNLNSARDTPSRLTPQFFKQIVSFIVELCR